LKKNFPDANGEGAVDGEENSGDDNAEGSGDEEEMTSEQDSESSNEGSGGKDLDSDGSGVDDEDGDETMNEPEVDEPEVDMYSRSVFKMLKCNELNVAKSDANYKRWKESAQKFEGDAAREGTGNASVNQRYTKGKAVVSMQKLLAHLASTGAVNSFLPRELESDATRRTTAETLVRTANNSVQPPGCMCWQDVLVHQVARKVDGKENLVHGFLEGLSKDQLIPYLNAVSTVQQGEALKLLIHAPPGCGKT
jgi:hypothetical protein